MFQDSFIIVGGTFRKLRNGDMTINKIFRKYPDKPWQIIRDSFRTNAAEVVREVWLR